MKASKLRNSELRNKGEAELRTELLRLLKEGFSHRMRKATGELGQTHLLGEVRRDIARVRTILREKATEA